jgi:hypothetical protein
VTNLEDSLRDYYTTKADELSLPARVFDSVAPSDDASVSYISMGPESRRRTPILLAAAASIALIAGAGVVVSRSSPSRGPRVVSSATTVASPADFPLLAATWLPDGYVLTGASDTGMSYPPRTLIFRDRSQPLGSPAILVEVGPSETVRVGSEITVQGRTAWDESDERNASVVMTDSLGPSIRMIGHGMDVNQLRDVAETVSARSADPADGVVIGRLPQGFEKVADYAGSTTSRQFQLEYSRPGTADPIVRVGVTESTIATEEIIGVMGYADPTPVTVRGKTGFQIQMTTPLKQTGIGWNETPGTNVGVYSTEVAPDVLLKIAEGLKSISPDELQQILSTTPEPKGDVVDIDPAASPSATFNCANSDSKAPQGQRPATCSELYRPPLWPSWLPNGFALSTIERTGDVPTDNWMLQYTTSVPGIDGVNDILLTIEASSPNGLDRFRSSTTSQPLSFRFLPTTVRGHEAFIISDPTGQNHTVGIAWMETPSQFVELESSRVSVNQLRQMAESFAPLLSDEWNTKIARNELLLSSATTTLAPTSTTTP